MIKVIMFAIPLSDHVGYRNVGRLRRASGVGGAAANGSAWAEFPWRRVRRAATPKEGSGRCTEVKREFVLCLHSARYADSAKPVSAWHQREKVECPLYSSQVIWILRAAAGKIKENKGKIK